MRKRIVGWLALCIMLGAMTIPFCAIQAENTGGEARYATVVTSSGTLNMRAEPGEKAKIVQKMGKGAVVEVLEALEDWTRIRYKGKEGYAMAKFLEPVRDLPYSPITSDDKGDAVLAFKKELYALGYLKAEEINTRFDLELERALTRLQLMNGVAYTPGLVTPELQAMIEWDMIAKAKSGYVGTAEDDSGLTVAIFCWDSDGTLYEKDQAVKLKISFAAQAAGGQPPYTVTVRKSLSASGGEADGDEVTSPFSFIWGQETDRLYVYATAVDAAGNTVTAVAPFRYTLPARYTGGGE